MQPGAPALPARPTCCTALYRTRHDLSCAHCTAAGMTVDATSSRDSTLDRAPAASTAALPGQQQVRRCSLNWQAIMPAPLPVFSRHCPGARTAPPSLHRTRLQSAVRCPGRRAPGPQTQAAGPPGCEPPPDPQQTAPAPAARAMRSRSRQPHVSIKRMQRGCKRLRPGSRAPAPLRAGPWASRRGTASGRPPAAPPG